MRTSSSGLQWADLKAGQGGEVQKGDRIWVEYMMTRRGGAKIYSTKQAQQPFSWVLGDGSVIDGLELMVSGSGDIPPLRPGGARRAIVPQVLGYGKEKVFQQRRADRDPQPAARAAAVRVDRRQRRQGRRLPRSRTCTSTRTALISPDWIPADVILRAPPAGAAERRVRAAADGAGVAVWVSLP